MLRLIVLCVVVTLTLVGCGEDESTKSSTTYKEPDWDRLVSADRKETKPASAIPTGSVGGVTVTISPQQPVAGQCLEASVKGKPSNRVFTWAFNGSYVQEGEDNRYCPEEVRRDDVVTVMVGDDNAGATASVQYGNTPPRIIDTRIELVAEGTETSIEIIPEIEDRDDDHVTLEYQWLINGEVNGEHTGNVLPAVAFSKGDDIQVKITPDDGYEKGKTYQTRNVNVPSAAPFITSRPPKKFEAYEYTYQVEATDPDGGALSFSLEEAPDGMEIDAITGEIVWPLQEVEPGEYQVKIVVTDEDGTEGNQEFSLNIGEKKPVVQE